MGKTQKRLAKRAAKAEVESKEVAKPALVPLSARVAVITGSLQAGKLLEGVHRLRELCACGQKPRLGSLQRWVRLVDGCFLNNDEQGLLVLRALLCVPTSLAVSLSPVEVIREVVTFAEPTGIATAPSPSPGASECPVVFEQPGSERTPPNRHNLRIFAPPDSRCLFPEGPAPTPRRHDFVVGGVPAVVVENALTSDECSHLLRCAEAMGYEKDEPLRVDAPPVPSQAVVWLAPPGLVDLLFRRIESGLAPTWRAEGQDLELKGLNPRFRNYRYDPGFVYRPHIDGAWPASGLDEHGKYQYDAHGDRRSRVTIVFYLNDDFEGGHTTFYDCDGDEIHAKMVRPVRGSVLLFPHGDLGAPVHEGSAVTAGTKFIIRTEALYALPNRKRGRSPPADRAKR